MTYRPLQLTYRFVCARRQGGLAISRNQVQGSRKTKFWHLDLSGLDINNKQDFQHPSTLHHLAIFLRDAMCR